MNGAKNWYFADGYLPAKSARGTICLLYTSDAADD